MSRRSLLLRRLLAAAGLLCALLTLGVRASAEHQNRDVLAVMSPSHIALLAAESGLPERQWQALFGDWESFGHTPEDGKPIALVETHDRTGVEGLPLSDLESYGSTELQYVKTLFLYDDYANRVVGDDPKEVENLLFRAVTDRGARLLQLTPLYTAEGELVTDIRVYQACLDGLAARLERRGYTFGEGCSSLRNETSSPLLLFGCGLLPLLAGCWIVSRIPRLKKPEPLLLWGGMAALAVLTFAAPDSARKLLMLAAAVVFPCAGACLLADRLRRTSDLPLWKELLCGSAATACWALLSGLSVAALMADSRYLLGMEIFSGVKLALLLPMAFGCCLLLWDLRRPLLHTGWKGWFSLCAIGAVLAAAALLLAVRSGDVSGGISGLETAFRNLLEYTLYARPRTKELLAAVPCIPLFFWACRRKFAPLQLLCGAGVCLEWVSVTNTFCHAVASLQVSVVRTLLGVGLGLIPGLLAVLLLEAIRKKANNS